MPSLSFRTVLMTAAVLLSGLCSCTQTEDPVSPAPASTPGEDEMQFHITLPALTGFPTLTRSSGMSLRYVARLYKGEGTSNLLSRQEETVLNAGKIVFKGEPGTYTVTIFADYIPTYSSKDANGHYPDMYYNTHGSENELTMMTLKDPMTKRTYSNSNINNPDLECFGVKITFEKKAEAYEKTTSLKRLVGKVRFVSEGDLSNVGKIKITRFAYHSIYSFHLGQSGTQTYFLESDSKPSSFEFAPSDLSNGELFSFYTFGGLASQDALRSISFEIIGKDGSTYSPVTTEGKSIVPKANRITTIKGNFTKTGGAASDEMRFTVSPDTGWEGTDNI